MATPHPSYSVLVDRHKPSARAFQPPIKLLRLATVLGLIGLLVATVAFSVFAFGAQLYAVRDLPIGLVDTLKRAVGGVAAVIWDRTFFGEPVTVGKLAAVGLMTGGVALLTL